MEKHFIINPFLCGKNPKQPSIRSYLKNSLWFSFSKVTQPKFLWCVYIRYQPIGKPSIKLKSSESCIQLLGISNNSVC